MTALTFIVIMFLHMYDDNDVGLGGRCNSCQVELRDTYDNAIIVEPEVLDQYRVACNVEGSTGGRVACKFVAVSIQARLDLTVISLTLEASSQRVGNFKFVVTVNEQFVNNSGFILQYDVMPTKTSGKLELDVANSNSINSTQLMEEVKRSLFKVLEVCCRITDMSMIKVMNLSNSEFPKSQQYHRRLMQLNAGSMSVSYEIQVHAHPIFFLLPQFPIVYHDGIIAGSVS